MHLNNKILNNKILKMEDEQPEENIIYYFKTSDGDIIEMPDKVLQLSSVLKEMSQSR